MIDIIVPIYNQEQYMEKCIESILVQSYQSFHLVLVNDGSTDESLAIAERYAMMDNRISVIDQENRGVSAARNAGLDFSNSEWIMFVDPDDYLEHKILDTLVKYADENADIISCCCMAFSEKENVVNSFFCGNRVFETNDEKKELIKQLLHTPYGQPGKTHTAIGVPWGKLYRRSLLEEHNLRFNPDLLRMQDNDFNMYAFSYAKQIIYVDEPLYYYRLEHIKNMDSRLAGKTLKAKIKLAESRYACKKILPLVNEADVKRYYYKEMLAFLCGIICNGIYRPYSKFMPISRRKKANQIVDMQCFKDLLANKENIQELQPRHKLAFFLGRNKMYSLLVLCHIIMSASHNFVRENISKEVYTMRDSDIILRTEQNRTEQNRTEQNRTEQNIGL